ncbi:MAG TPA: hypothetical protein VLT62_12200 [Candidatus Methylomirabilis sp.]|nr:hypothetical protein [Candidatus Methylomirabilis sp.]
MTAFVDPRVHSHPPGQPQARELAAGIDQVENLHRLCREGRVYEVEGWIKAGQPLQVQPGAPGHRGPTALHIALETGQHSLLLLLLCNGYRLDLEPVCPLTCALAVRRWEYVDLFWAWGADPKRVSAGTVFDTYNSALFDRFHAAGVDFLAGHALADALGNHTSNKPLFGWAKRHRENDPRIQVELNMALGCHAHDGSLKGVHLCLWAGADPHAAAPDLRWITRRRASATDDEEDEWSTAIQEAVSHGHVELLPILKPDPTRDDFNKLYHYARDGRTVRMLAASAPPTEIGDMLGWYLTFLDPSWSSDTILRQMDALETLFAVGGRWAECTPEHLKSVRRHLLKLTNDTFVRVLKLLTAKDHCSPAVLQALGRIPTLRQRMVAVGLLPPRGVTANRQPVEACRSPKLREVANKLGIRLPKPPPPPPPRVVEVGADYRSWERPTIRLTRQELYERVWAEPVESLAKSWGLSGRGLAKVCERMGVPVPPRGYWARIQHGQHPRKTPLRVSPGGDPPEIVIHVAKK